MENLKTMRKQFKSLSSILISTFIFFMLFFVRSFMGIYIFGYRIGEYLIMFSLLTFLLVFIFFKKISLKEYFDIKLLYVQFTIFISFLLSSYISKSSFSDTYTFKTSSYIWTTSLIYVGFYLFNNFNIENLLLKLLRPSLLIVYYIIVINYISRLEYFFLDISDKYELHKGSDLAILYLITILLNNDKNNNTKFAHYYFFLISSIFLPLILYSSRAAFFAVFLFFLFQVWKIREQIIFNKVKYLTLIVISLLLFTQSVFLVQNSGVIKIYEAKDQIENIVKYRYETLSEKQLEEYGLFWVSEGRLYSSDGNLNWRLEIWQDVFFDTASSSHQVYNLDSNHNLFFGYGYKSIIPAMNDAYRMGIDGLNENIHNYFLNIYARGGLMHFLMFLYFYYLLIKNYKNKYYSILAFILPIMFISFFDSSMENAHFPILFYIFIGRYFALNKNSESSIN